ncbi:MAG: hypothetical protein ACUZ8A_07185 [Candidatus Bathyanammoxibius sp.]
MAKTRTFDGKVYSLFDFAFTKAEANSEAKSLRKKGKLVRVVPAGTGYHIWAR